MGNGDGAGEGFGILRFNARGKNNNGRVNLIVLSALCRCFLAFLKPHLSHADADEGKVNFSDASRSAHNYMDFRGVLDNV